MTYTKLKYKIDAPKPHLFIGSKIRGMLGYALKEEVCINPSYKCEGCFAAKECAFYRMYEERNRAHDYRMDFTLNSKKFTFSLLLFGTLQKEQTSINNAMLKALGTYKDVKSSCKEKQLKTKGYSSVLKITFLTPLRLKRQGKFLTQEVHLQEIIDSIERRYHEMEKLPRTVSNVKNRHTELTSDVKYMELNRRSNKQKKIMSMGGLMGEIIVSGVTKKEYELLKIGEVIGVGKSTVFGLGKIKIEEIR